MSRSYSIPKTFTEAQERSGFSAVIIGSYRTQSNSRFVPYAEVYRGRTSLIETPAEHLQKAAQEDEQHIEK
jgi:hypothetical protein